MRLRCTNFMRKAFEAHTIIKSSYSLISDVLVGIATAQDIVGYFYIDKKII